MVPICILVAKPGMDKHDRDARILSYRFRETGMEVIYTGLKQNPQQIVSAVLQEDVDALGISILSGGYKKPLNEILPLSKEKDLFEGPLVFVGGIIDAAGIPDLKNQGLAQAFPPGTDLKDVIRFVNQRIKIDKE